MSTFNRSIPYLALLLCAFMSSTASADMKVGVVSFQKLFQEAPQTKTAMTALKTEFGPRERELTAIQADLKSKDEKLQKEGAIMSEADRSKADKTLRDGQRELQRKYSEYQDDVNTRKNEELGRVQRFIAEEIQNYAAQQGFDLVLGEGVFYAKSSYDITSAILAVLQSKPATIPASSTPAPAAAPAKPAGTPK
jgi:outer membrane protein